MSGSPDCSIMIDMEWSLVVTSWALIAAGIMGTGLYLHRVSAAALMDSALPRLLQRRGATHDTLVTSFLSIFDGLFGGGATGRRSLSLEKTLWVGVVLAPAIVFILRFGTWIVGRSQPSKLDLLLVAISISFVYAIVLWLWLNAPRRMRSFDVFPAAIFVVLPVVGLPALFVGLGVADSLPIWRLASSRRVACSMAVFSVPVGSAAVVTRKISAVLPTRIGQSSLPG